MDPNPGKYWSSIRAGLASNSESHGLASNLKRQRHNLCSLKYGHKGGFFPHDSHQNCVLSAGYLFEVSNANGLMVVETDVILDS